MENIEGKTNAPASAVAAVKNPNKKPSLSKSGTQSQAAAKKQETKAVVSKEVGQSTLLVKEKSQKKKWGWNNNSKNPSNEVKTALVKKEQNQVAQKNKSRNPAQNKKPNYGSSKLSIIPLGGLGEVGKNMTAIKYNNNILLIDAGLSFPDDELLGIDLVIPDYTYLLENKNLVRGLVITHGHEDHVGCVPYLLKDLDIPIYGSRLTLGLLQPKFKEHNIKNVNLNVVSPRGKVNIGPFQVEFIRVSHSIPDSFGLAIFTPVGTIVHTGDFKMDMSPIDGQMMDLHRFASLGDEGVLLMLSDSTNVEKEGYTQSEKVVGSTLQSIFYEASGRIILTTFASNVHRVQQAVWAAEQCGRKVAVVGRGMVNMTGIAKELGYFKSKPSTLVSIDEISNLPDNKVVIITTGSQGEPLSGLTRMSLNEHRQVHIGAGDLVVISASAIPGNEKYVARTIDNLYRNGAKVIYGKIMSTHVSGHASSEELKMMLNLVKPKFFVPVHGEYRMLCRHAELAERVGIDKKNIFIMENGDVLDISSQKGEITGKVPSGRVLIDGLGIGDIGATVLKDRKQLSNDGIVVVTIAVDKTTGKMIVPPEVISRGFVFEKENEKLLGEVRDKVIKVWHDFGDLNGDVAGIRNNIRNQLGKMLNDQTGRRPIILPIITLF